MTDIQGSKDCGNSPKNKFVQEVAIALEMGGAEPDCMSEELLWELPSNERISGRAAVLETLAALPKPKSIAVQHAISHGKVGAASGKSTLENGHIRRFCHVFEFTNAKANCVAVVKSYG